MSLLVISVFFSGQRPCSFTFTAAFFLAGWSDDSKALRRLGVIPIVCCLSVGYVQAQLKSFQPGDVIKSSEVNGNFEYLLKDK